MPDAIAAILKLLAAVEQASTSNDVGRLGKCCE